MSGFSPDWLALREPADHSAVNAAVRLALTRHFQTAGKLHIVDLGCGTGSNLRGLSPWLSAEQRWTLIDHDPLLLDAARARYDDAPLAGVTVVAQQADFAAGEFTQLVAGADLVTAAALFDLVSVAVIDRLAETLAAGRQTFYTTLTYDGIAAFLPEHPHDGAMRDAFNVHQQTDKGFGPAAGPEATEALAAAFSAHGYRIVRGKSPWVLDHGTDALRRALDAGWAEAVRETGHLADADIDRWRKHRINRSRDRITIVGHEDLLALPPA